MAALPKAELEKLEAEHGLTEDGLTYQQRCSRIAAVLKGEPWEATPAAEVRRGTIGSPDPIEDMNAKMRTHPLYGKRLLITPLMTQDKNRALYFDEELGPEIEVEEVSAGKLLYGASEDVDRMVGDYKIVRSNPNKVVTAKTTLPKSGQEISWAIGEELVPVVRGNDQQRGYIWQFPTHTRQFGDTIVQMYGLKTLITQIYPELLPRFAGKPLMMYIDGLVLAASIPLTEAILKEKRLEEMKNARLGF